ncbi:unnamed protein product [Cuscuta epithymum]|uniref:ATP-dependent zinc metalloprotease FTSH, chloroplastic n=2 Tax=Cuscuta epithymum TaxID=186058 RepID=A0AAV0FTE8_9ASTE|nr:unnamed protein product [Cuscuta epithymum]
MAAVEVFPPIIHPQILLNWSFNSKYFYRQTITSCSPCLLTHGSSSHLMVNPSLFRAPPRITSIPQQLEREGTPPMSSCFRYSRVRVRANSSCEQGTDSDDPSEATATESKPPTGSDSSSGSSHKESQGKADPWWSKWHWQPIVQGNQMRLLLQLGVAMFFMRLFRPEIPFPGSEPIVPLKYVSVPYSEFLSKVHTNQIQKVEVDGVHLMFKLKNERMSGVIESEAGSEFSKVQESELLLRSVTPTKRIVYTTTRPDDIKAPYEKMLENKVEFGSPDKRSGEVLSSALASVAEALFHIVVLACILHSFNNAAGQLMSRKFVGSIVEKAPKHGETVTFADVAGIDEAKEELEEIVEFLRNPDRFRRLGARPPRGVLLVGLPGTGKTLLAKAVAGEANVPFISCSGSEFVEMYVGVGASRVRALFDGAKLVAPSIIFIDEIDAVAKSRDGKFGGSNDERETTLNQLLIEMDGFDSNSAVIVLGSTNRSDVLDPALRRPGRFDRVVMVEAPDRTGREAILKVHVSKKELPLGQDVDLGNIASMTTGFTGADLANLVNEAALLAGRKTKLVVEKLDFTQAVERSIAGIEKKTSKLQGNEKAVVARHEAGHAVVGTAVASLLAGQPRVEKLSIVPRSGGTLGFAYIPPTTEDRYLLFVDELRGKLVTLLGGRAAEEVIYSGRVSTGALDDIRRATDMAYKAIAECGLNETIGPVSLASLTGSGMDDARSPPWGRDQGHLVDLVQREVRTLLQSALEVALCVVRANLTVLEGLGASLEEKEKVGGEELQELLKSVVAPTELACFIAGKQQSLLQLQPAISGS